MSKSSFVGVSAGFTALVLGIIAVTFALPSKAAGDYPFLIRAYVETVNTTDGTILARGISSSTAAITDTQSKNVTYSAKNAAVYRWENGVKVPRNINFIKTGQEIVLKGNKKGGSFIADVVTINDRAFDVVGRVVDFNTSEKWIKILVGRSTLSHLGVVNKEIKFYYTDNTDCLRLGTEIDCTQIDVQQPGAGKGIKVRGVRSGPGGQWDITNAWYNYPI